jgi:nucleoid-associated protein YgaU
MGLIHFIKNLGRDVDGETTQALTTTLNDRLPGLLSNLTVDGSDGTVTLAGTASSDAAREKAILLAGNVQGVEAVDADGLTVAAPTGGGGVATMTEPTFYTIQTGDTLSKIAKARYGRASAWRALFEANREVIEDPDLIYPGQQIRIPDLDDE